MSATVKGCIKQAKKQNYLMKQETLLTLPKKTKKFIEQLQFHNIPLNQINVNDFQCNCKPSVYITIPYGVNGGGKSKRISNNYLNSRTLKSSVKFYNQFTN